MIVRILRAHLLAWMILTLISALLAGISMLADGTSFETIWKLLQNVFATPALLIAVGGGLTVLTLVTLFIDGGGKRDPLAENKPRFDHWLG